MASWIKFRGVGQLPTCISWSNSTMTRPRRSPTVRATWGLQGTGIPGRPTRGNMRINLAVVVDDHLRTFIGNIATGGTGGI